jgi:hypothetical protein
MTIPSEYISNGPLLQFCKVGQEGEMPLKSMTGGVGTLGWSELAPTNAPVTDEPVEAVFWMDENPILPARFFFFFSNT